MKNNMLYIWTQSTGHLLRSILVYNKILCFSCTYFTLCFCLVCVPYRTWNGFKFCPGVFHVDVNDLQQKKEFLKKYPYSIVLAVCGWYHTTYSNIISSNASLPSPTASWLQITLKSTLIFSLGHRCVSSKVQNPETNHIQTNFYQYFL